VHFSRPSRRSYSDIFQLGAQFCSQNVIFGPSPLQRKNAIRFILLAAAKKTFSSPKVRRRNNKSLLLGGNDTPWTTPTHTQKQERNKQPTQLSTTKHSNTYRIKSMKNKVTVGRISLCCTVVVCVNVLRHFVVVLENVR
jgi:hypothetical protein